MHRLTRISACAALLAGLLRVIAQFIPATPDSAALELLYGVIDAGFVLALTGLAALTAPRLSWGGLALLLAALVGAASIVGPDRAAFGIDFYLAGSALFVLALGLAAPLLALAVPALRSAAAAWALAMLAALASAAGGGGAAFAVAGLALAAGFMLAAPVLWRGDLP